MPVRALCYAQKDGVCSVLSNAVGFMDEGRRVGERFHVRWDEVCPAMSIDWVDESVHVLATRNAAQGR